MNYKYSPLSIIFLIANLFLMISCSDSEIRPHDVPEISQSIFIIPEAYTCDYYSQYASAENFYIDLNKKVRICSIYSVDSEFVPTDQSKLYYSSHQWTIDNEKTIEPSWLYSFDKPGIHKISLETIDFLGDTLISHANIYVNTPINISLQFPPNHYNQVDGNNQNGLELSWKTYGIDPWESSVCIVYASYHKDNVWERPLGETECTESVELMGRLNLDINEFGDSIDHSVDNSTIYWGVRAVTKNSKDNIEQTFSEIFNFSTTLENNKNAIIEVPIACKYSLHPEKSQLNGAFISATGDTLANFSKIEANTTIRQTLQPQSNVKIVVCDSTRTEYGCNSIVVNLMPSTKTTTDTIFLQDKIKPNMIPATTETSTTAPIKFFILDNGSGVNASKITTIINEDTLQTSFEDYTLSIPNTCKKECSLFIYAEDYAKNKAPEVYWRIKVNKAITTIEGPYSTPEEN